MESFLRRRPFQCSGIIASLCFYVIDRTVTGTSISCKSLNILAHGPISTNQKTNGTKVNFLAKKDMSSMALQALSACQAGGQANPRLAKVELISANFLS